MFNTMEHLSGLKNKARTAMIPITGTAVALGTTVLSSASSGAPLEIPQVAITTDMIAPIAEGLIGNLNVLLPVCIGIFTIMMGIRLVPTVISRFFR